MSAHAQGTAGRSGEQYGALTSSTTENQDAFLTSPYQLQDGKADENDNNLNESSDESFEDEFSEDGSEEEEANEMSITELLYSSSSYHAIVKPVSVTMILSALAVVLINTDETRRQWEKEMAEAYTVWNVSDQQSTGAKLGTSLANTLVMVSVICCMTFVMVLCYKMRCMKFMIGYMIFASSTLLGLLGGTLFKVAVDKYRLPIDVVSFVFAIFNFCIVGVLSIFWSLGIPSYITQCYLVATSVILAWQLAHFDEWTTWTLLFMLACYDLCAVLTPCGPLKALVNLMSKDDAPEMPGLLYEAELPPEARRPGVPRNGNGSNNSGPSSRHSTNTAAAPSPPPAPPVAAAPSADTQDSRDGSYASTTTASATEASSDPPRVRTAVMPLAIARVYNLPVIAMTGRSSSAARRRGQPKNVSTSPLLSRADEEAEQEAASAPAIDIPENPTPRLLRTDVTVRLPPVGGTVERIMRGRKRLYLERDRHGTPKRTLWVDRQGKVFAEMEGDDEQGGGGRKGNSIKLGLGDFIFYSVLVAKAAMYSFATFAACMLVILAGLGGTLVLLSVYHHALPALPISIFMAIIFYLLTRMVIEPWIENVMTHPMYV